MSISISISIYLSIYLSIYQSIYLSRQRERTEHTESSNIIIYAHIIRVFSYESSH